MIMDIYDFSHIFILKSISVYLTDAQDIFF